MWTQRLSDRPWAPSEDQLRDYQHEGTLIMDRDRSDFSPAFWLATSPTQGGKPPSVSGRYSPMIYPLLIAIFLLLVFISQRSIVAKMLAF
jgi:hypothetical protein